MFAPPDPNGLVTEPCARHRVSIYGRLILAKGCHNNTNFVNTYVASSVSGQQLALKASAMAKSDMERVGVFSEMGYTTIGDPYVPPSGSKSARICSASGVQQQKF